MGGRGTTFPFLSMGRSVSAKNEDPNSTVPQLDKVALEVCLTDSGPQ
jgi:hypothetical protein